MVRVTIRVRTHVVGRLGSGPRVEAGGYLLGVFSVGGCLRG